MSDPDFSKREWRFYVSDMIDFAQKVLSYTDGLIPSEFITNSLTYDAALRNLDHDDNGTKTGGAIRFSHSTFVHKIG